jgi:methyltransferase-like protein/trans-aconitate methyltransferase
MTDQTTAQNAQLAQAYDAMPYMSLPFADTAPENLHARAVFLGLTPAAPAHARVLEIGSASGGNLIPFALRWPESECVGIDLSPKQIEDGQRCLRDLNITNCSLLTMDIMDMQAKLVGKFDYIICHGVFSWIPDSVRTALMAGVSALLAPLGVAYISYNTLPGWHTKMVVRDFMRFHTDKGTDMIARVAQARAVLQFAQSTTKRDSVHGHILQHEFTNLQTVRDDYIAHEYLEPFNHPMYFRDFVELAHQHSLGYLDDTERWGGSAQALPDASRDQVLALAGNNAIMEQQYLDFLSGRLFRRSLLVHRALVKQIQRGGAAATLDEAQFATSWQPSTEAMAAEGFKFTHPTAGTIVTPSVKSAALLRAVGTKAGVTFAEALASAQAECTRSGETFSESEFRVLLQNYVFTGVVQLFAFTPDPNRPTRPKLMPLVRWQLEQRHQAVTSATHTSQSTAGEAAKAVWRLLDGTKSDDQVALEVAAQATAGKMALTVNGRAVTGAADIARTAQQLTEAAIKDAHLKRLLG